MNIDKLVSFFDGYKTYIVGLAAIIYGLYTKNTEVIVTGFGMMGLRSGITTEIGKVVDAVNAPQGAMLRCPHRQQ